MQHAYKHRSSQNSMLAEIFDPAAAGKEHFTELGELYVINVWMKILRGTWWCPGSRLYCTQILPKHDEKAGALSILNNIVLRIT